MKAYTIAFLGDAAVGKTSAIKALKGVWYASAPYVATMGVEVHPMIITVDGEKVVVNLWDVGATRPSPPEGSWSKTKQIDATCVFYDTTSTHSFHRAMEQWMAHAKGVGIPVGTKLDSSNHKPQLLEFAYPRTMTPGLGITAKDPAGIERMLMEVVRRIRG